jgi:peptide/nickel transport system permease protein
MKVARYVERRLLHSVFLLVAISVLAFGSSQLAPGNFLDELRMNPQISSQTIAALQTQYGLDQPIRVRYFRWMKSLVAGDLGYSLSYNMPVNKLLWERMHNTLLVGTLAMLLAWAVALPMGIWSARRAGGWFDGLCSGFSTLLLGTPELALALLLILAATHFGTLPAGGMNSSAQQSGWSAKLDTFRHLLIPMIALALPATPLLFRHIRAAMLEAWTSPFLQAAKGHGIGEVRLLLRHALPVASNPLISLFGLSLATLVSGSFLVEVITGWPGMGPLFLEAIYNRDAQVVMAVVMLFSVFLLAANFTADLLLYAADPRVRAEC